MAEGETSFLVRSAWIVKINGMSRPAVFLDRDGTIINDTGFTRDPAVVQLLPGAGSALAQLKRLGFQIIVVSNQSGIGRGLMTPTEAKRVHDKMIDLLAEHGVSLDAAYYCPHRPEEGCRCRKPGIAQFEQAALELDIDLTQSFMVGDRATDAEAGRAACCRTIVLSDVHPPTENVDCYAVDWEAVVRFILAH